MSNTYVLQSTAVNGDKLTVTALVNGSSVTWNGWISAIPAASMASAVAFLNYLYPYLLDTYNKQYPAATSLGFTGSLTI
jgi:hypothetical protein